MSKFLQEVDIEVFKKCPNKECVKNFNQLRLIVPEKSLTKICSTFSLRVNKVVFEQLFDRLIMVISCIHVYMYFNNQIGRKNWCYWHVSNTFIFLNENLICFSFSMKHMNEIDGTVNVCVDILWRSINVVQYRKGYPATCVYKSGLFWK